MKDNTKGFTAVEFIVGLAVIGMIVLAIYLYQTPDTTMTEDDSAADTTSEESMDMNTEQETFEENADLEADSSDETVNEVVNEVNDLSDEINDLDTIDSELDLPSLGV